MTDNKQDWPEDRGTADKPVIRETVPTLVQTLNHVHSPQGECLKNRFGGKCA